MFYRIPYRELWRTYYGIRNLTYLGKIYSNSKFKFIIRLLKKYLLSLVSIILFDDHKITRIYFISSAYLDGLMEIFDNKKPKRILYGRESQ
ncbi:hypothetical protein [Thermococcus peptonophilus]